jgi:hypothetical protein
MTLNTCVCAHFIWSGDVLIAAHGGEEDYGGVNLYVAPGMMSDNRMAEVMCSQIFVIFTIMIHTPYSLVQFAIPHMSSMSIKGF